jgi:ABC-type antimicrobial peptide transport system permease subunit
LANLRRTPGRTLMGALCLAVGVAGLTIVLAITWAFHGRVTGTLLGDAVSVQVRGVDLLAVIATVVLGVAAVADVLYLNLRDRAAELSALRALGWSETALGRLVTYEALAMAVLGGGAGAGIGLWAASQFAGGTPRPVLNAALGCAAASLVVVSLAALGPVALQRRVPMSTLLAEE